MTDLIKMYAPAIGSVQALIGCFILYKFYDQPKLKWFLLGLDILTILIVLLLLLI